MIFSQEILNGIKEAHQLYAGENLSDDEAKSEVSKLYKLVKAVADYHVRKNQACDESKEVSCLT